MSLFKHSREAAVWVGSVCRAFFQVRPWTSWLMVSAVTTGRFAALLAFFLPLKVILLAGSDGVPRYFRFFIDPDEKFAWIVGLSIGAVGFYVLSLLMDAAARRLAEAGSFQVLQGANEIAVASRQREEAQSYYARFSGIMADMLILLISFSLLGWLNLPLLLTLIGLVLLQYLFSAAVLGMENAINPGAVARMIRHNLSGYLNLFYSINFLAGFFVILAPFMLGAGGNLLLAILSMLLMRQGLGAISTAVTTTTSLWARRNQVDPMVFRDRQMQKREAQATRKLRRAFEQQVRERMALSRLEEAGVALESLASDWRDSTIRSAFTFRLKAQLKHEETVAYFQHQVFPEARAHLLEHEDYLFTQISRSKLPAPPRPARFSEGPFECQICDYPGGRPISANHWREAQYQLLGRLWAYRPPRQLVAAYRTSRPGIDGRLSDELIKRLSVAVAGRKEANTLAAFIEALPTLRQSLADLPQAIANPDLRRVTVARNRDGQAMIMTWSRWSIEPIGAFLPPRANDEPLSALLQEVRQQRGLAAEQLGLDHVKLAYQARLLERDINANTYRKAIARLGDILENPLMNRPS